MFRRAGLSVEVLQDVPDSLCHAGGGLGLTQFSLQFVYSDICFSSWRFDVQAGYHQTRLLLPLLCLMEDRTGNAEHMESLRPVIR